MNVILYRIGWKNQSTTTDTRNLSMCADPCFRKESSMEHDFVLFYSIQNDDLGLILRSIISLDAEGQLISKIHQISTYDSKAYIDLVIQLMSEYMETIRSLVYSITEREDERDDLLVILVEMVRARVLMECISVGIDSSP